MPDARICPLPGRLKIGGHCRRVIPGAFAFYLHDTIGFPIDLTVVHARDMGWTVDMAEFNALMEQQRARGRASWKGR